ncbi:MAG: class A beta-lactamase, subclass A2 [Pyrinomonadaceae bacterium]|nr:class A beta-lactamase, subclass A2 [Pyrinomonadaceae bacterium]
MHSFNFSKIIFVIIFLSAAFQNTFSQNISPKTEIEKIIKDSKGIVGISVLGLDEKFSLKFNDNYKFAMQSVYKFPLAMAVLDQVDKGKFTLEQKFKVEKGDLKPNTWSPMREDFPNGTEASLADLLRYTVAKSDNNICDYLIKLVGGTKNVQNYLTKIGIKNIAFAATEEEMSRAWEVQYTNWSKPSEMTKLLKIFFLGKVLSKSSNDFLWKTMVETSTGPKRLKGLLPEGTIVAHKTGTSGTNEQGITAAVNDVGIVQLPNGKHFAITVFVSNSTDNLETNEEIIARITKIIWNYFLEKDKSIFTQSLYLVDESRKNRSVPVEIYQNKNPKISNNQLVLLNPGYKGANTEYSFIAENLANQGYFVASIQHDLATDEPIATTGNLYELRMPAWERGVQNVQFVISELKKRFPKLDYRHLNLIGHSMGGDISMLFVKKFPEIVKKAITLDHRRMKIPRLNMPGILSIRADEFEADAGVLPNEAEQKQFGIKIVTLKNTKHGDLSDFGSAETKQAVNQIISDFLKN